jgi:VIT1/CCC1 family predicted Fe2+/Mn2+ transporter
VSHRSHHRLRYQVKPQKGFLEDLIDPIDRLSETVFSILILMTFTLVFYISELFTDAEQMSSGYTTHELVIGALWSIFAWGTIDGIMYVLFSVFQRGESHRLLRNIQAAESEPEALEVISDNLDYILEPISEEGIRQKLYKNILENLQDSQPRQIGLTREDLIGGLTHVPVALFAVLPSLVPLVMLEKNFDLAILISNLVSIIVLFVVGYRWGKHTGGNPWRIGLLLMAVAMVMVLLAILLGG